VRGADFINIPINERLADAFDMRADCRCIFGLLILQGHHGIVRGDAQQREYGQEEQKRRQGK
jgi:hypothetical protein